MSTEQPGTTPVPSQPQGFPPAATPPPPPQPAQFGTYQPSPYQAQPGWTGQPSQYPSMAPAPKSASPLTDPKTLADKLPLMALLVLIGFGVYGVYSLIMGFVNAADGYGSTGGYIIDGIFSLVRYAAQGLVYFSILMALKYVIDLIRAKSDGSAK